jgi:hypothetical protein
MTRHFKDDPRMIAEPCDREPRGFTPGLFYSTCEKRCPNLGSVLDDMDDALPDAIFSPIY